MGLKGQSVSVDAMKRHDRACATGVCYGREVISIPSPVNTTNGEFAAQLSALMEKTRNETTHSLNVARRTQIGLRGSLEGQRERLERYATWLRYCLHRIDREEAILKVLRKEIRVCGLADKEGYLSGIEARLQRLDTERSQFEDHHDKVVRSLRVNMLTASRAIYRDFLIAVLAAVVTSVSEAVDFLLQSLSIGGIDALKFASKVILLGAAIPMALLLMNIPGLMEMRRDIEDMSDEVKAEPGILATKSWRKHKLPVTVEYEIRSSSFGDRLRYRLRNTYREFRLRNVEPLAQPEEPVASGE